MTARKIFASLILLGFAALHGWSSYNGYDSMISAIYAAGLGVGAAALLLNFHWARFFGLGIAATGVAGCAVMHLFGHDGGWFMWTQTIGFVLLGLVLMGRRMSEKFEGQAGWGDGTLREHTLSWAVIFNFAMLPMLVKYLGNDGDWVTAVVRVVTAVTLTLATIAVFLLLRRRTAGLLLLGVSGVMSVFLAVSAAAGLQALMAVDLSGQWMCGTAYMIHSMHLTETAMVVAGVVPGALASLLAMVSFAGPMIRLMREG